MILNNTELQEHLMNYDLEESDANYEGPSMTATKRMCCPRNILIKIICGTLHFCLNFQIEKNVSLQQHIDDNWHLDLKPANGVT